MQRFTPYILILIALVVFGFTLLGEGGIAERRILETNLKNQSILNTELAEQVNTLKTEIHALKTDDRALEKVAREELLMARPNELIFLFEKKK